MNLLFRSAAGLLLICVPAYHGAAEWAPPVKMAYFFPSHELGYTRWNSAFLATSENGRYRVTEKPAFIGDDMVFSLTDTFANHVLWRHRGGSFIGSRAWQQAFVSDDGWTVFCDDLDNAQVIRPDGSETFSFSLIGPPAISESERDRYVQFSSDGPAAWGESSCYIRFATIAGRDYFCIRYWWGRRVAFDLTDSRPLHDLARIEPALARQERQFVICQLNDSISQIAELKAEAVANCCPKPLMQRTMTAALMAGQLHVREAAPMLRQLEPIPFGGDLSTAPIQENRIGKEFPAFWDTYSLRQFAQLSLRRLGAEPGPYPETQPEFDVAGPGTARPLAVTRLIQPRSERIGLLSPGQFARQVINAIGAPDFLTADDNTWEYDIDSSRPCTLRVIWVDGRVKSIKTLTPPLWQRGTTRDVNVVPP